jgi:hypothetical protein
MIAKDTFRQGSRKDWTPQNDQAVMNREQIAVGLSAAHRRRGREDRRVTGGGSR